MKTFVCTLCQAQFVRDAHLRQHVGTRRCLLRRLDKPRESHNLKRQVARGVGPFVRYLKDNVKLCNGHGRRVLFVPFCNGHVAADIHDITKEILMAARHSSGQTLEGRTSGQALECNKRVLLACGMAAVLFTVSGAR